MKRREIMTRSTMKMLAFLLPSGHSLKWFVAISFNLSLTEKDKHFVRDLILLKAWSDRIRTLFTMN